MSSPTIRPSSAKTHYANLQAVHDLLSLNAQELAEHAPRYDEPGMVEAREAAKSVLWAEISKLRKQLGISEEE